MQWKCRSNFLFHASPQMFICKYCSDARLLYIVVSYSLPVVRLEYDKQKHSGCKLISHSTYRVKENWVAGILFKIFPKA